MTDRERGVVWEECIIFTPPGALPGCHCHLLASSYFRRCADQTPVLLAGAKCVFLSATLPNALEFAEWVRPLHRRL